MRLKVIPIINENDVVAIDEIGETFGDNDIMSAMVASNMNADLLIILSDIEGLYDKHPLQDDNFKLIKVVKEITADIEKYCGGAGEKGVGGMRSKVNAAKIATANNCDVVITNGALKEVILRQIEGEDIGTIFLMQAPVGKV